MTINIETNTKLFFRQYLEIINPLIKSRLSNCAKNVLSELMRIDYKYKSLNDKDRAKLMFDYDTKIEMSDNLNISMPTLNNMFLKLRKESIINKNTLKKMYRINPGKEFTIEYKFKINDDNMDI